MMWSSCDFYLTLYTYSVCFLLDLGADICLISPISIDTIGTRGLAPARHECNWICAPELVQSGQLW